MIFGMLIRGYKVYKNLTYIPLFYKNDNRFISYIGDNGSGKSSILEALDTYFNGRSWNVAKEAKMNEKDGPHIVLVHVLKRENIEATLDSSDKDKVMLILQEMSEILIGENTQLNSASKEAKRLLDDIKSSGVLDDDCFVLVSGIGYNSAKTKVHMSSFESILKEKNNELSKYCDVNKLISDYYSYIYIPVETSVESFTKLETLDMQKLMGKNIKDEIAKIIEDKNKLKEINEKLKNFTKDVEQNIQKTEIEYKYKSLSNKQSITKNDFVQKVIELFFSIQVLHKNINSKLIPVQHLSSGEKRAALIDVASALINSQAMDKELILAIDEPEASLNISKLFLHFDGIINLSEKAYVIIATHWYGFVPIARQGMLYFLQNLSFTPFDLYNYREQIKQIKQENYYEVKNLIGLKGINDLVQAIVSSVRSKNCYNWIICEGRSDKIYLEYYLSDMIERKKLRIIPVGGCVEVVRLYDYLAVPLMEKDGLYGKIFCLIDSDENRPKFNINTRANNICLKRLYIENNKSTTLDMDASKYKVVEIEDCLNADVFIDILKDEENEEVRSIVLKQENIKDNKLIEDKISGVILDLRDSDKNILRNFFKEKEGQNKIAFANKYIQRCKSNSSAYIKPYFIKEIIDYFD